MVYSDIEIEEEDDVELRSETLSLSNSDDDGPAEPIKNKRERLRAVLLPAIQSRVSALGGYQQVQIHNQDDDEQSDNEEQDLGKHAQFVKVYKLGDECLGCLKDLKRFWRMDDHDDDRNVARIFYETGLLHNDLVPIVNGAGHADSTPRQEKAALAGADLIAAMTWPINVIEELREAELTGNKSSIESLSKVDYRSLLHAQRSYKKSLLKNGQFLKTLVRILVPRLEKGFRDRNTRDENVISLVLHVWRNLAAIKDKSASTYHSADAVEDATLQSELICQFSSENVFDLLITISSLSNKSEFNQWNMICLEIFNLIFRCVSKPESLVQRSLNANKVIAQENLNKLLAAEDKKKKLLGRKAVTRHSRFGTTVVIESAVHTSVTNKKIEGEDGENNMGNGESRRNVLAKDRIVLHKQSAIAHASINPGKILDQGRMAKGRRGGGGAAKAGGAGENESSSTAAQVDLTNEAIKVLQIVALSFLESAFNPFFASVLKDIRMERSKVRTIDNIRFLFLSSFFIQYFLSLYTFERAQEGFKEDNSEENHDFDLIAEVTDTVYIGYVCMRMKICLEDKNPMWTELHAATDCFVQLLLTMDALQSSGNEDYKEVSEILQNKLYYDKETLDMALNVLKAYKQQPLRYLDSIINLNYVLLRMLEKYSKNKNYMYVRKKAHKRAKQKKAKALAAAGDDEDEAARIMDEEEEEIEAAKQHYDEHQFEFEEYERRFSDGPCIHTLLVYLAYYKDFTDDEQMKRAVNLLHRAAIRAKSEGLFFKGTTLELFRRIIDDRAYLPKTAPYKDLSKLINYILKKFFKAAQENPLIFLEIFYTHRKSSIDRIVHLLATDNEDDEDNLPKKLRMPAELEIKKSKNYSWSQQVGIAVALLSNDNRDDLITFIKDTLRTVAKARQETVDEVQAKLLAELEEKGPEEDEDEDDFARRKMLLNSIEPSDKAKAALTDYAIDYGDDEELQHNFTKNSELKLLLRLLKWESKEAIDLKRLEWFIPASVLPQELLGFVKIIDEFLINPLNPEDGESINDLIQKKRKPATRRAKAKIEDKSSGAEDQDEDDVVFSDPEVAAAVNGGKKLKRKRSSKKNSKGEGRDIEGGAGGARRKKRIEEAKIYRTAEFIVDSDDDEEAARAFFEREAELRRQMEKRSGKGANKLVEKSSKGKKGKKDKTATKKDKGKRKSDASEEELSAVAASDSDEAPPSPKALQAVSHKSRPKARPVVKKAATPPPTSTQATTEASSSSPAQSSESNPLKRSRNDRSDTEEEDSARENTSPQATATQKSHTRKAGRMVVDSDEEEED